VFDRFLASDTAQLWVVGGVSARVSIQASLAAYPHVARPNACSGTAGRSRADVSRNSLRGVSSREQLDSSGGHVEDLSEVRFAVRVSHDAIRYLRKDCQYQGGVTDVPFDGLLVPAPHRLSPSHVLADPGGPNYAIVFEADRIYPSPDRGNLAVTDFGNVGVCAFFGFGRTLR
jgi:hypothetical protein